MLSRSSFGSFFFLAAFLKKRISTLIMTRKQLKVLKVRQISVYALTVRSSPWVSDLVHEVSERQLRSKEETEREYVKSDCADMHLSSENTKIYSFTP